MIDNTFITGDNPSPVCLLYQGDKSEKFIQKIIHCTTLCMLMLLAMFTSANAQEDTNKKTTALTNALDTMKRYIKVPAGYLMVLRQGDDVLAHIEKLAKDEKIPSANFTGMGFVNTKFGFFNFQTKEYEPKEFNKVELASMSGTIAWQDGKVSLHTHGVVTDRNFTAHGGHLLNATVDTGSVEILVTVHQANLERKMEQPLGANILQIKN